MNLGDVHLNRDGTIRFNGDPIGYVFRIDGPGLGPGRKLKWRAEVGDIQHPEAWPSYLVLYGKTRREAVERVLSGIEVPV